MIKVKNISNNKIVLYGQKIYVGSMREFEGYGYELVELVDAGQLELIEGEFDGKYGRKESSAERGRQQEELKGAQTRSETESTRSVPTPNATE